MSIMDIVRNWSDKRKEKSETFKKMQEQDRLERLVEERKKSANKRELEKYIEQQEEAAIKKQLDIIHKKQNKDNWKSNTILKGGTNILKEDRPILREKNIFVDNKNKVPIQNIRQGMFFRW